MVPCLARVVCLWIFGIVLFVVGVVGILLTNRVIGNEIKKKVVIKPGSETYPEWLKPSIPIYMQIYPFHINNSAEFSRGAKPVLVQKGPYTYRETREKVDVVRHLNGTLSYRQIKAYYFLPNMSFGSESDVITSINLPVLTLINSVQHSNFIIKWAVKKFLQTYEEGLTINRNISEIVWGYHDPMLKAAKKFFPSYTDFVGIFMNHNNTDDGNYSIFSGDHDISKVGMISTWNGAENLTFWTSDEANMINGTDGTILQPFISKNQRLYFFSTDICRSIYAEFFSNLMAPHEVPVLRFRAPKSAFEAPDVNPANAGFCTPAGNCLGDGLLNISACQTVNALPLPIITSNPHFLMADTKYLDAVLGLNPDPAQHSTDLDIEPNSGLLMSVAKRLQINAYVSPVQGFPEVADVTEVVLPILWVNESAALDDDHVKQIRTELLIPKTVISIVTYALAAFGLLIMLLALVLCCTCIMHPAKVIKDEEEEGEGAESGDALLDATPAPGYVSFAGTAANHSGSNGTIRKDASEIPCDKPNKDDTDELLLTENDALIDNGDDCDMLDIDDHAPETQK